MDRRYNVLFLCTGNSARSILAESIVNNLPSTQGRFRGYSAGSHPKGAVNPFALALLREQRFPIEGLRSKSWKEFEGDDAPRMDVVFTVCDQAAAEECPYWPGQPITVHWGLPDPAAVEGTDEDKRRAFRDAFLVLKRRIELLASLPMDQLSGVALRDRLREIGRE